MQFGPDATTELVIPAGTPFQPGNDVIGIGTGLPAELAAYRPLGPTGETVKAAIIFYSSAYDPAATVPQVKYFWIGIGSDQSVNASALCTGCAIVANASVSQVAVINSGSAVVPAVVTGTMVMNYVQVNHNDNTICISGEQTAAGNGILSVLTNAGALVGPASGKGSLP